MVFDNICTPNKTSRNSKLFYEGKGKLNFIVATVKKSWAHWITGSTLLLFIVSNMFFNIMHFRSQPTFIMSMYTKSSFLERIMGNGPAIIHFEFEPDLYPKPEKLCEHGTSLHLLQIRSSLALFRFDLWLTWTKSRDFYLTLI